MTSTLLEQTRGTCHAMHLHVFGLHTPPRSSALHEEMERLERAIVADYKIGAKGHKDKMQQNHRVKRMVDMMQHDANKLVCCNSRTLTQHPCVTQLRIYEDKDGARKEDINALRGDNVFTYAC